MSESPARILVLCPHCRSRFSLRNPDLIHQTRPCPQCNEPFEILDSQSAVLPVPTVTKSLNRTVFFLGLLLGTCLLTTLLFFSQRAVGPTTLVQSIDTPLPDLEKESLPDVPVSEGIPEPEKSHSQVPTDPEPPEVDLAVTDSHTPETNALSENLPETFTDTTATEKKSEPPSSDSPSRLPAFSLDSFLGKTVPDTPHNPMAVPPVTSDSATENPDSSPVTVNQNIDSTQLTLPVTQFDYIDFPLDLLIEEVSQLAKMDIEFDYPALSRMRIPFDTPVTLRLKNTLLREILNAITHPLKLTYQISGRKILITENTQLIASPKDEASSRSSENMDCNRSQTE